MTTNFFGKLYMRRAVARLLVMVMALQGVFVWVPRSAFAAISNGANAIDLIGQYTDASMCSTQVPLYTKGGSNNGPNTYGLDLGEINYYNGGLAIDTVDHRLFVSDTNNARVLVYDLNVSNQLVDKVPDRVLGQPTFNTKTASLSQSGMNRPQGIAFDATNDRLFVADFDYSRVLVFNTSTIVNGENAVNVIGQADFVSDGVATTISGFDGPRGLAYDSANSRLFIVDYNNGRVIVHDVSSISDGQNADNVLGKADFDTNTSGLSDTEMGQSIAVAYDPTGNRLFVSEAGTTHRVLVFNVAAIIDGEAAVNVLGQPDFVTAGASTTSTGMNSPGALTFDDGGDLLYVADSDNNRVLVYDVAAIADGESAVNVLGQTLFTTSTAATTQDGMQYPGGLFFDADNDRLLVADLKSNRVTTFSVSAIIDGEGAVDVLGQSTDATICSTQTASYTKKEPNNGPSSYGLSQPGGMTIDSVNHRLFVSEYLNNRVLVFNLDTNNALVDRVPDAVLGQSNFSSSGSALTQSGLSGPAEIAYDSANDRLFVVDAVNVRVLVYDVALISNGENAVNVLGQDDFVTIVAGTTSTRFDGVRGLEFDAANERLFVVDSNNNRVIVFDTTAISDGEAAVNVLGQTLFTTQSSATTAAGMSAPADAAYDPTSDLLYVSEQSNNRVLVFDVAIISDGESAVNVLGQSLFTTSGDALSQTGLSSPLWMTFDDPGDRLFVADFSNARVIVYDVAVIADGEGAVNVLGKSDFTTSGSTLTQAGMSVPAGLTYDETNSRLVVSDSDFHRITFYDAGDSGTTDPTLNNSITASRLKAGASSTYNFGFTLQNTISGTLTITFPAGFTVTAAATSGACTGGTVDTFGFTSSTLTAVKTGCTAGALTLSGATVTNHSTPGAYTVTWVNDDPGEGVIYIIDDDQVTVTGNVDPSLTFNAGMQDDATACDGTFSGNGGTLALGVLTTGAVTTSDASSVDHICTRLSTNASGGASVTVRSLNGTDGLKSTSVPTDTIPSSTATLSAGTAGYGLCTGSAGGDSGNDAISGAASPTRSSPFNTTCTNAAHDVGGLTTSAQNLWTLSGPSQNAFVRTYVKAAISGTTAAHADYADTLTFIGTGTF